MAFSGNCRHTRQQWHQHYFERLVFAPRELVVWTGCCGNPHSLYVDQLRSLASLGLLALFSLLPVLHLNRQIQALGDRRPPKNMACSPCPRGHPLGDHPHYLYALS